jgi:hypothetical protein
MNIHVEYDLFREPISITYTYTTPLIAGEPEVKYYNKKRLRCCCMCSKIIVQVPHTSVINYEISDSWRGLSFFDWYIQMSSKKEDEETFLGICGVCETTGCLLSDEDFMDIWKEGMKSLMRLGYMD